MNQATSPWTEAEIAYRTSRIRDGITGSGPRRATTRRRDRDRGSWGAWRSRRPVD